MWVDYFKGDVDIVALWLETMQNYLRSGRCAALRSSVDFGTMTEALEVKTVNMLLDLFVIYNDSSMPALHIEFNILSVLLNFFFRYTSFSARSSSPPENILKACRLPSFQHALRSLLVLIFSSQCSSLQIAVTPSPPPAAKLLACFQITNSSRRFSPISPSDQSLSYDSTISPPTQLYYVVQKPVDAPNGRADASAASRPKLSDEDRQFLFDKLLLYVTQFFQGIIQIDEQNRSRGSSPFDA